MNKYIKTEFIKEKRSANVTLMKFVPVIVVVFIFLMVLLMGRAPAGKSYTMVTMFNWYPTMILPVIVGLLVTNSCSKETASHVIKQKSLGISNTKTLLAKNVTVLIELCLILLVSSLLCYGLGTYIFSETIQTTMLVYATIILFIGSLPLVGMSFLFFQSFHKKVMVILINFLLVFPSAVIAVNSKWVFFPWAYSLRMLAPIVKVHPNGTFLVSNSPLMDTNVIFLGIVLSIFVWLLSLVLLIIVDRRKGND